MDAELKILFRLGVTLVLAGILGWERQVKGKEAGLRTHILVGVGATLFVGLGELLVRYFSAYEEKLQFDPTRVLEAVVAGVAFLGAGIIFFAQAERRVHGLTTAASVWSTAGVGMAVGLGAYVLATGATALLLLVLRGLALVEERWLTGREEKGESVPRKPSE
jgi:putative Mg2+ transporter-C (MgtC) family protein